MKRSACIILVLIVSSYPKVRASIHDISISMFRGYTTTDKKKNKIDKDAFIYHIPQERKEWVIRVVSLRDHLSVVVFVHFRLFVLLCYPILLTDSGEPNKIFTTRKGQLVEMKRWLGSVKSRQETFFSRVKSFNIMKNRFRHG